MQVDNALYIRLMQNIAHTPTYLLLHYTKSPHATVHRTAQPYSTVSACSSWSVRVGCARRGERPDEVRRLGLCIQALVHTWATAATMLAGAPRPLGKWLRLVQLGLRHHLCAPLALRVSGGWEAHDWEAHDLEAGFGLLLERAVLLVREQALVEGRAPLAPLDRVLERRGRGRVGGREEAEDAPLVQQCPVSTCEG